ncbi:MAG: FtsX-like permease family protein [Syntrophomonadaceae bacterium]|nr:FtsX-like permease family protein [Syntrophomonadaceae bacterium]
MAVVVIVVTLFVGINNAYINIEQSMDDFNREYGFADYYFQVIKAPESVQKTIADIPGVLQVNGRIQQDVQLIQADSSRILTGRLTSYALPLQDNINRLYPLKGQLFDEGAGNSYIPVLVNQYFADNNNFEPGDPLKVITGETVCDLTIAGTAISPEFQSIFLDAFNIHEGYSLGIIMMAQDDAQKILRMGGQINQILLELAPGADEKLIRHEVARILEPYGLLHDYPQSDHLGERSMRSALETLGKATFFLPYLFLVVLLLFLFVLLKQIIMAQRPQIGIMKALGYDNSAIMKFFALYALVVTSTGTILGIAAGYYLSHFLSLVFAQSYNLPYIVGGFDGGVIIKAILVCTLSGVMTALLTTKQVTAIEPAEAMKPPKPPIANISSLERFAKTWKALPGSWKMTFRSIGRNKSRFIITTLSVTFTIMLLLTVLCYSDSEDKMLGRMYGIDNSYDYMVCFSTLLNKNDFSAWRQWDEIEKLETITNLPVTFAAPGADSDNRLAEEGLIIGLDPATTMKSIYNTRLEQIAVPESGILLSQKTAEKLNLKTGDMVVIETTLGTGREQTTELKIVGLAKQYAGTCSFISSRQMDGLLHASNVCNTVLLQADAGDEAILFSHLENVPKIENLLIAREQKDVAQKDTAGLNAVTMVVMAGAFLMGFALIYNTSVMMFSERQRELAALKVMGVSNRSMASFLFNELLLSLLLGIILGVPLGRLVGEYYINSLEYDYISYPFAMETSTYITAVALAAGFVLIGHGLAMLRLKKLDFIDILKNRD